MTPKILLDTMLLVLLAVGLTSRQYIAKHKRLERYSSTDLDILSGLIARSGGVVLTPNVLSETSNLARQIPGPAEIEIAATLALLIGRAEEHVVPSSRAVLRPEYLRLGLTDAVLLEALQDGIVLVTDDKPLYLAASNAGSEALYFSYEREHRRDLQ